MTVSHGKPYAGKPHVRFDEGAGVPGKGRSALLHGYGVVFNFSTLPLSHLSTFPLFHLSTRNATGNMPVVPVDV